MIRTVVLATAFVSAGMLAVPAATLPTFFPTDSGDRLQLHITRATQGFDQPAIVQSDFVVQRKTGDTFTVERKQNGTTLDSVLTIDAGGTLQLAASERDADVRALLPVLAIALDIANNVPSSGGSVLLSLPVGEARTTASVVVPIRTGSLVGNDFALHGTATTQLQPGTNGNANVASPEPSSQGRRRGGFSGGVPAAGPQRPAAAPSAMNVLVRIDGQVVDGHVRTLTIAQTREINVGGTPFVSLDSWTIEVQ